MAARGDLWNLLRGERRHHVKRVPWLAVEEGEEGGNLSEREEEPSARLQREEEDAAWRALLQSVRGQCDDKEKQALELLLAGERSTAVYAAALGISEKPFPEQEREVKKVKDRLKKRLERGGRNRV